MGMAAYLSCYRLRRSGSRWMALPFVALAVGPDTDYLGVWLFDYSADPRITHSLLFALVAALSAGWAVAKFTAERPPFLALLAASASHPALDLLVGAHPVPLLWPWGPPVSVSVGVLPSAGALPLGNYYLWRNLAIELGLLLPVLSLIVALCRRIPAKQIRAWALPLVLPWAACVACSISLGR